MYSGIFSADKQNHPIVSIHTSITGKTLKSTGLSRAFSEIVRGNFHKARIYNPYSLLIFIFFVIQFFQRIIVSILITYSSIKQNKVVLIDSVLSILLFLFCFKNFILF